MAGKSPAAGNAGGGSAAKKAKKAGAGGPAKKRKRGPAFWDSLPGWEEVEVGEDFLLGAEEGGFAGLEVLDDPAVLEQYMLEGGAGGGGEGSEGGSDGTDDGGGGGTEDADEAEEDAPQQQQEEEAPDMSAWEEFELAGGVLAGLAALGFANPTPIQRECLGPAIRARADIIGAAQTGSGKTLAFGLPILHVCSHLQAIGRPCGVRVLSIVGGISDVKQARQLAARPAVIVATPGRLWDLMCSRLADRLTEASISCLDDERDELLYYLLAAHPGRTLVFANAVSAVRRLGALLALLGLPVYALHAQQQQRQRLKALDRFRANPNGVLVATDVAARGLDIPNVSTVVHYQIPPSADTYIHRCGRTARGISCDGIAIALVTPREAARFSGLCRLLERPGPPASFPVDASLLPAMSRRAGLAKAKGKAKVDTRLLVSRNQMKKQNHRGMVVIPQRTPPTRKNNGGKHKADPG
eukprot:XP_001689966.1 predicted protein [Chlamydomonas reinhardtii]